ncbi:disease resistance protein Roq1-like [Rutidosis leptorrhynchoides]|uniref:disease resistance protein Roq1-like n=1 Tax=Rutidosis leptorrhynchoides TaxID=125765 RepID=UPI003A999270
MSSLTSYSQTLNHDVFLSFRGEDTRKTFVDHLYTALVQQGIRTYKDDETLPRGESIGPALLTAIRESGISVIVFSQNYADSSWCLDELAYIMKCKDEIGIIVMPIFYHVDPSEVRKQKGKFGEAFLKHMSENNNKIEVWKNALVGASNISGWEMKHIANGAQNPIIFGRHGSSGGILVMPLSILEFSFDCCNGTIKTTFLPLNFLDTYLLIFPNTSNKSMSSLTSYSQTLNHDVFLSFRGEDTRKTFVDHLYTALVQQGIRTYKDDETLPRGESIGPALLTAIRESGISVIVFSQNYADSSWCLDELAYIMKCKDEIGIIVMPIFYHVDPSEVRKQKGKFGEAFLKHMSENNNKIEVWKNALVGASNISGWEMKHIANGHESKGIKEIVDAISNRLIPLISNSNEDLIGIEARLQDLNSEIEIETGGVRMVGIWGVGGGGKTTLATSIYSKISNKFIGGCCFLKNIREESNKHGLERLQEKVMRAVLKQKHIQVDGVVEGRQMMMKRLCHRNVLIVLDDVDHPDHLKALAGSHNWFGEGSRIIITTRDKHLLNVHKVNAIYNIRLLNKDEGINLFRKHAPRDHRPLEDYELLSKSVVSYAGGLPLALIVLSSFLSDKDMDEWVSALARLKEIPETDIMGKLKISFDGLKQVEKELFLDIACFFRGEKKIDAMESLDACGFHPVIGVKVLIQKALVTILDGKFDMHDLIQELGHYIVRGEQSKNPEEHSRVWKVDEVENICSMDSTTEFDKIEAIRIFSDKSDALRDHNHHVVAKMKNLRWIDWKGHHASSLPTSFPQRKLCCLILSGGQQKQLWNGNKNLPNLKMIKLHGLTNLIKTPDFRELPNLKRFIVNRSPFLEEIDSSIERSESLAFLLITSCDNLREFPSITGIKNLKTLSLSKCGKLSKSQNEVASCISQYVTTFLFRINHEGLQFISKGLTKLVLSKCHLGDEDISSTIWDLSNLQELDLSVNDFTWLNFGLLQLPRLKWLDISSCNRLVELLALPSSIAVFRADYCYSLDTLGDISNCKWLWKVSFLGKNKLDPAVDKIIRDSMLQGNGIQHQFMSLALEHRVLKLYEESVVDGSKFVLQLPHNWDNDFSGFLIHCVIDYQEPNVTIVIKQEVLVDEEECNHQNELSVGSHPPTYIGYISFNSLRNTKWWNPAYSVISFFLKGTKFEVELIHNKGKGIHHVETIEGTSDCSEFWDGEREDRNTFTIQHDSKTSINLLWCPC